MKELMQTGSKELHIKKPRERGGSEAALQKLQSNIIGIKLRHVFSCNKITYGGLLLMIKKIKLASRSGCEALRYTAWNVSKYGVISGPYSVRIQENT